jgi:hypothetical protein
MVGGTGPVFDGAGVSNRSQSGECAHGRTKGGDKNAALSSLKRAIMLFEIKPQDEWSQPDWGYLDALVWAGWAYEQIDQPGDARASYLKALTAEPRAKWVKDLFLSPLQQKLEKKGKS